LLVAARKCTLLVVDDEPYIIPTLTALLASDFHMLTADSADAAQELFGRHSIDLILTDQKMPRRTGVQLLEWVRQNHPKTIRLLMTGYAELDNAIEAINRGHVYHYLAKPWRTEDLLQVLRNAADKFCLERDHEALLRDLETRVAERTHELQGANVRLQKQADELKGLTEDLQEANVRLQKQADELKILSLTDPLTGLFNRRAMEGLADFELKRHARYPNSLSLGLIDVDHFKNVNTQYLYTGGDETLKGLSRILTATLREVDSVGRIGGEEFLVLAREANEEGANILAERIRSTVEGSPIAYHHHRIPITVSIGFAVAEPGVPVDYAELFETAAAALKEAKDTGRNRCVIRCMETHPAG
jgi:diguanylate cyclase (GGDEF)-like protein